MGIGSKFSSAKWDYWQTLLSRGDENLAEFLIDVYKNGGKNGAYKSAFKNFDIDKRALEGFLLEDELPWDFIINYPPKN